MFRFLDRVYVAGGVRLRPAAFHAVAGTMRRQAISY
jgi:hypothetical protein